MLYRTFVANNCLVNVGVKNERDLHFPEIVKYIVFYWAFVGHNCPVHSGFKNEKVSMTQPHTIHQQHLPTFPTQNNIPPF